MSKKTVLPERLGSEKAFSGKATFSLTKHTVELIDGLVPKLDATSMSEVVKISIGWLAWAVRHLEDGYEIAVVKGGESRIAVLPVVKR